MRPSSLLFTLIGDYFHHLGMEIWVGSLIKYMEQFGFSDGAVRVTLSRMSQQGWLKSRRIGQRGFYHLTAKGQKRIRDGVTRVYQTKEIQWDNQWRIVVDGIPEKLKEKKEKVRKELQWTGFGYLGNNVWISPHNLYPQVMELIEEHKLHAYVDFFTARYDGPQTNRDIVQKTWQLDEIKEKYEQFLSHFEPLYERLYQMDAAGNLTDSDCFTQRALLVHEYRKFLFIDPKLPREVLPADWIGDEASNFFKEFHRFLSPKAEKFFYDHLCVPED